MNDVRLYNELAIASAATVNNDEGADNVTGAKWFHAMAKAWGKSMDDQAAKITDISGRMDGAEATPSLMLQMTAEAQAMSFLSNSASSCVNASGKAMETLARRQ